MKLWRIPFDHDEVSATPGRIYIDNERCKGCGYCVDFCPRDVLKMSREMNSKGYLLPVVDDETKCAACGYCEAICPEFAIRVSVPASSGNI